MQVSKLKSPILFGLIFLFTSTALSLFAASATASVHNSTNLFAQNFQYRRGMRRGGRFGGGSRSPNSEPDQCPTNEKPIVALAQESVDNSSTLPVTYVGGLTTAEHPTLWFYIPYAFSERFTAEFTLWTEADQEAYTISSAELAASQKTPGVISVSIPATVTLELGETYEWSFEFNCGSRAPTYVRGGIERIPLDPSLESQLAQLTPAEQSQLYFENGIWFDALNTVAANLHRSPATEAATEAEWNALLKSVGLAQIPLPATAP